MSAPDDVSLLVLRGHLLIEELLEKIITNIVAHKEILDKANLSFYTKATIARAMCWDQHENEMWELIFVFNTLRNELAHSLNSENTDKKIKRVLNTHIKISKSDPDYLDFSVFSIKEQLHFAIVYALGFLGSYERDSEFYRKTVDQFYKTLKSTNEQEV